MNLPGHESSNDVNEDERFYVDEPRATFITIVGLSGNETENYINVEQDQYYYYHRDNNGNMTETGIAD